MIKILSENNTMVSQNY